MNEDNNVQNQNAPLQPDNKQIEDKKNPSDNLTPDHPRFREVVAEKNQLKETVGFLQQQLDEMKEQIAAKQVNRSDNQIDPEEEAALERIASKLRQKQVFVTKDDLSTEKQALEYERLSDKYPGGAGKSPKFDPIEVQTYAKRNGFSNLEKAYKDMHFDALVQLEAKRQTPTPPDSERADGRVRQSPENAVTPDDIKNMSDEEYEEKRASILAALRPHTETV